MERSISHPRELSSDAGPRTVWRIASLGVGCVATIVAIATFATHRVELGRELLAFAIGIFALIAGVHARFLYLARQQYAQTKGALEAREHEFQSMFENALDAILILDGHAICRDANPSALQLLGVRREQLIGKPIDIFYSDQREFHSMWDRLLAQEHGRGQSEMVGTDGARVFVEFTATADFLPERHMMILRDITQRRQAEEAKGQSLALAKSAWQEADALRRATLALTQDLHMNYVLDTLLKALQELVPYEAAQVLLLETDSKLFLACERLSAENATRGTECPKTLDSSELPVLRRALNADQGFLISDTLNENSWQTLSEGFIIRSWLGVPLRSTNQVVGLLSVAHTSPGQFTAEHLRVTGSLAVAAAAAIQNARLYEQASIYGTELERRLSDLRQVEKALEQSEENRAASEERFQKVFRSTPIPFSVTSLADGTFIEVNEAFERRYGYTRRELIGRTSTELGFWDDPSERTQLIDRLRRGVRIRGAVARFRIKSGEFRTSLYSAEVIHLDDQSCLLVVSDDMPQCDPKYYN
jgi:PAS domain S-box-containing protein